MKGGLIVLDGPDASGKTTLAEFMRRGCGGEYIHLTYIKDNAAMYRANYEALALAERWMEQGNLVTLDRGWISENIYSRVYRGGSQLAFDVAWMDRWIRRLCGVYVICAPTPAFAVEAHAATHQTGREMYAPDERIKTVAELYRAVAMGNPTARMGDYVEVVTREGGFYRRPDSVIYDREVAGDKIASVTDMVLARLEELRRTQIQDLDRAFKGFVGHGALARYLYVVEGEATDRPVPKLPDEYMSKITQSMALAGIDELQAAWVTKGGLDELDGVFDALFTIDLRNKQGTK